MQSQLTDFIGTNSQLNLMIHLCAIISLISTKSILTAHDHHRYLINAIWSDPHACRISLRVETHLPNLRVNQISRWNLSLKIVTAKATMLSLAWFTCGSPGATNTSIFTHVMESTYSTPLNIRNTDYVVRYTNNPGNWKLVLEIVCQLDSVFIYLFDHWHI